MVLLHNAPEIGIFERMALDALTKGHATYENCYRPLADCHGLLTIGAQKQKDDSVRGLIVAGHIAMQNIFDRMQRTKKVGASSDELEALRVMVDVAEDFWKRQSASMMRECIALLKFVRAKQIEERKVA